MYANTRAPSHVGVRTLAAGHYTDPGWFGRELDRVFYTMWLYAGRGDRIATPGEYFVFEVGKASVIVVRDEAGEIRAFHNVCRHRGTLLCAQRSGRFPSRIQCRYHAWTYRLDGTLAHAPHMDKVDGFSEADHPLRTVAVAVWDGHIFVNLSARPEPFESHMGELLARFRNWTMEDMCVVDQRTYQLRANWKLVIQNYHECLHCPIAHPQLNAQSHYLSGENEPPTAGWLGARMDLREGVRTLSTRDDSDRDPLPALSEVQRRSVYYYAILPNMLINLHPDYVVTFRLIPRAVDHTEITCEWLFSSRDSSKPGFDPSDAVQFWDRTNRQDWELSDLAQRGISTIGYRPGPYSNREELLVALDRWILHRVDPVGDAGAP